MKTRSRVFAVLLPCALVLGACLVVIRVMGGCQHYSRSTPPKMLQGDDSANYERVFDGAVPEDVEVLNSVVVGYAYRIGVNTTDDWEFELLAPRTWIDSQIKKLGLRKADYPSSYATLIEQRKTHPIRAWYAPKSMDSYDLYYLYLTSIPYVHMLVEKEAQPHGRYRVFVSKH